MLSVPFLLVLQCHSLFVNIVYCIVFLKKAIMRVVLVVVVVP